jgi:energy-coupling factor transporter ATP-binding protein EcfA2
MYKVEIFGPPGSGKTVLANRISLIMRAEYGVQARSSQEVIQLFFNNEWGVKKRNRSHFAVAKARAAFWVMRNIGILLHPYFMQSRLKRYEIGAIMRSTVNSLVPAVSGSDLAGISILVNEPGFCMALLNGYFYQKGELSPDKIRKYVDKSVDAEYFIGLAINPSIAVSRLKARVRGAPQRMRQLEEAQWPDIINVGNKATELLISQVRSIGLPYSLIDNSDHINDSDLYFLVEKIHRNFLQYQSAHVARS